MGGDCLNVGCVPSKALIAASRAGHDFPAAMARMRKLRVRISENDSARRFKQLGVDLFFGEGRFTDSNTISVNEKILKFKKAAICTGARAKTLSIPGLKEAGFLTNETMFSLTDLPPRLAVIGAGPIGCEMAQTFARFHSQVVLFAKGDQILPREDADAAKIVANQMGKDGVSLIFNANITRVTNQETEKVVHYRVNGIEKTVVVDAILVGVGRTPNVESLGLKQVAVKYDMETGVAVNDLLQTTNPHIYAAGDVCSPFQFTHTADAMAKILIQNALFPHPFGLGLRKASDMVIPWCTYTSPEIAHVGITESDAIKEGIEIDTFTYNLSNVDRAILDGEEAGFVRVHVEKGTDKILGATIVAVHAGEMMNELTLAIKAGIGLKVVAETIHPYPTQAEVINKVANEWRKSIFTQQKKNILQKWFDLTR